MVPLLHPIPGSLSLGTLLMITRTSHVGASQFLRTAPPFPELLNSERVLPGLYPTTILFLVHTAMDSHLHRQGKVLRWSHT